MPVAGERRGEPSPREQFERSLGEIERAVSWVARRHCMSADEVEELRSRVHLKLIEDDYRVLRGFSGRSSLATYLTTVIQNLARDDRTRRWGRWRPSAAAERLGLVAVQLETLVERDGFGLDEAIEMLRANHGVRLSRLELVELAARLPPRTRRRLEGDEAIAGAAAPRRADEGLREAEHMETLERARRALAGALAELDVEDRLILKMHYQSGLTIAAIAAALDLDQRRLYSRRERCWRQLRSSLEGRGVAAAEVLEALGWSGGSLEVDYGVTGGGDGQRAPSNRLEGGGEENP